MSGAAALAAIPLVTSLFSAFGQYKEAQDQAAAARRNAALLEDQAKQIQVASDFALARMARRREKYLAAQRTLYHKSGVKLEGSPIEVLADTATEFELDAYAERYNTSMQIKYLQSEAALNRKQAASISSGGIAKMGMTLLTGAAEAGMSYGFSKAGTGGGSTGGSSVTGKREYIGSYAGVRK